MRIFLNILGIAGFAAGAYWAMVIGFYDNQLPFIIGILVVSAGLLYLAQRMENKTQDVAAAEIIEQARNQPPGQ